MNLNSLLFLVCRRRRLFLLRLLLLIHFNEQLGVGWGKKERGG